MHTRLILLFIVAGPWLTACGGSGGGAVPVLKQPIGTPDAPAGSGSVLHFSLEELVRQADVIARGTTQTSSSAWDAAHRRIWTTWDVNVSEAFKGWNGSANLALSVAGGTVGSRASTVSGEFIPEPEREYVFFLWRDPDGRLRLLGKAQGAFAVSRDGGDVFVANSFRGVRVLDHDGSPVAEKVGPIRLTLAELKRALGVSTPEPGSGVLPPQDGKGGSHD